MAEINHFSHTQHPLKLLNVWEIAFAIVDDHEKKKDVICCCNACDESIMGGYAYGCISCRYFLHKICANVAQVININKIHHPHPFKLTVEILRYKCDFCHKNLPQIRVRLFYKCQSCYFHACIQCGLDMTLKEEASNGLFHEGHHRLQHELTLQSRPATFRCDACYTTDEDVFYKCDSCDFWIHNGCLIVQKVLNLPHHHHPLTLVFSLPENFYNFDHNCEFCKKSILRRGWLYHCENCRFFYHLKCALNAEKYPIPSDAQGTSAAAAAEEDGILHFPMSKALMAPLEYSLKLLHVGKMGRDDNNDDVKEISHWSHDHPLILNVESHCNNNTPNANPSDPIEVCYGCVRPLSLPYYRCKDGCPFTLHRYCAELPLTLSEHQLHLPNHPLRLVNTCGYEVSYWCEHCHTSGNTFAYKCESCDYHIDVNCAFLPTTIKHESHKHPLVQAPHIYDYFSSLDTYADNYMRLCEMCHLWDHNSIKYTCREKGCNFMIEMLCAIRAPRSIAHRYCKGHEVLLTYPPVEDHPEDFFCDICEEEMHPKTPLYHCQQCKNSFHIHCLARQDPNANIKKDGTLTLSYHKHPLTFVRRQKTADYICFGCNKDINGRLILECGACPFRFCYNCYS